MRALARASPRALASLPKLETLLLNGNRLEGCIPAGLERFDILAHDGNPGLRRCDDAR